MNRVRPSFSSALTSDGRPCTLLSPTVGQTAAAHVDANASGASECWLLAASVLLGVVVTLSVFAKSGGVPFVTDGNESFSTYNHAQNLLRFGPAATMGLTDEAAASDPAAHAYVYTHQGNFPRFASLLLLLLGVHSLLVHVAIISVTVGAAATALCFRFFARATSPQFAALVCLVFWTDYLLFVQWQANSYRVWHALFLFGALACAQAIAKRRPWPSLGLFATAAGLYYFEFIFAVFVTVLVIVYSLLEHRNQPGRALPVILLVMTGGGLAITLLGAQLLGFLGPELMLRDIQLTYLARNFAAAAADVGSAESRSEALRFFMDHHIVFWDSFDATRYQSPAAFARTIASTVLVVYSPLLATMAGAILAGLGLGSIADIHRSVAPRRNRLLNLWVRVRGLLTRDTTRLLVATWAGRGIGPSIAGVRWIVVALVVLPAVGSVLAAPRLPLSNGQRVVSVGFPTSLGGDVNPLKVLVAFVLAGGLIWLVRCDGFAARRLAWGSLLSLLALSAALTAWLGAQGQFYPSRSAALWLGHLQGALPAFVTQAALLDALVLAALFALRGTTCINSLSRSVPVGAAARYLVAGAAAFLVVYAVSPGYLYGGYLSRLAPLPVFVTDVALAVVLYLLVRLIGPLLATVGSHGPSDRRNAVVAGLAAFLLVFVVTFWVRLQLTYITYLPPDSVAFLSRLEAPAFQNAGVVSNNYALPMALATGGWAFQDETLNQRRPMSVDEHEIETSGKYMWFSDRDSNPKYLHPQYYVCRTDRNLDAVADLLTLPAGQQLRRCSGEPIVQQAATGPDHLVARDQGPADAWAIVALGLGTTLHPTWRDGAPQTDPATPPTRAAYAFLSGFYDSEVTGRSLPRWSSGYGVLALYPGAPTDEVLALDLVQPDFGQPRSLPDLTVSVDERPIAPELWRVEQPTPGHYTLRLPLVLRQAGGRPLVLTLRSPTFIPAQGGSGSVDGRELGVRVEGIRMEAQ